MAWRSRLSRGRRCAAIFDFHTAPDIPVSFAAALRTLFARDMGGGLDSGVATVRASAGGATASVARSSPDFVIDESQLLALALVSDEADDVFLPLAAVTSVNLRRGWRRVDGVSDLRRRFGAGGRTSGA